MEPQKYIVTVDKWGIDWQNEAGELHRLNGPAVEFANGTKEWWLNGKLHRLDGPAVEWSDGGKEWWVNDKRHRLDGPAIECSSGEKEWYIDGKQYTETQFNKKKELNDQIKKTKKTKKRITNEYYELTIIKLSTEQITDIRDDLFSYISYVSLIHFDVIYGIDYKTNEIKILKNRYDIESYYKFQGVDCLFNYETELQIKWQSHNARVLKIIKF